MPVDCWNELLCINSYCSDPRGGGDVEDSPYSYVSITFEMYKLM